MKETELFEVVKNFKLVPCKMQNPESRALIVFNYLGLEHLGF